MSPVDPTPTWSVSELHAALGGLIEHVFGDEIWVEGELRNLNRSSRGHVYFDLVDADGSNDNGRPMLAVTLFDRERQAVNRHLTDQGGAVRMADGVRVRIRGRLTTYPARSTVQLRMSWIDPAFTLGVLGLERERVLALLATEGLLGQNAQRPLPSPALTVALVTSVGSAAHADALDELRRSGIGFRVLVIDARTQGTDAPRSLVRALRLAESLVVDVVALVRGGGARTDLAAFDSEEVARAVASLSIPVLTGIGHEIDRTATDEVAHGSHKTPTACAAALVAAARTTAQDLQDAWTRVDSAARGRVVRAQGSLEHARRDAARAASHHLARDDQRVAHLATRVIVAAPRRPAAAAATLNTVAARVGGAADATLERTSQVVEGLSARARGHDPAIALRRGWSILRDEHGGLVRSAGSARPGDKIVAIVADGSLTATVDGVHRSGGGDPADEPDPDRDRLR